MRQSERMMDICRGAAPPWTCNPITCLRRKPAVADFSTLGKQKRERACAAGRSRYAAIHGGAAPYSGCIAPALLSTLIVNIPVIVVERRQKPCAYYWRHRPSREV